MKRALIVLTITLSVITNLLAQCNTEYLYYLADPNQPFDITFIDSTTGATSNATYTWDFGDGNTTTAPGGGTTHTYNLPGSYITCLTVTDNGNICGSYCDTVSVAGGCNALFSKIARNQYHSFLNHSDGDNLSYNWDFGDGNSSTQIGTTHTYAFNGTYTVCLEISNAAGCSDIFCDTVFVGYAAACIYPDWQLNLSATNEGTFTNNTLANAQYSSTWFVDGTQVGTSQNLTYQFTYRTTPYNVCLEVTSGNCTETFCDEVFTSNDAYCQAQWQMSRDTTSNLVTFTNTSVITNTTSVEWTINGVTAGTGNSITHQFPNTGGTIDLCLTVDNGGNCTETFCDQVSAPYLNNLHSIRGQVFINGSIADTAFIYLIKVDSLNLTQVSEGFVDNSITRPNYFYDFHYLRTGTYLIKAALAPASAYYNDYLPTYYGDELFWSDATVINLTQDTSNININLIPGNNPGGPGFVGGLISQGANKRDEGDPEPNVQVMLLDMNNDPVQCTYSNAQGEWEFSNIAYGTYQVYAEVPGKTTEPVTITIDAANETINNIDLVVETQRITGSGGIISSIEDLELTSTAIFPNPTTGVATITITTERTANAEMVVLNTMGQEVMREELTLNAGQQELNLNISNNPTGIYFMQLRIEGKPVLNQRFLKK